MEAAMARAKTAGEPRVSITRQNDNGLEETTFNTANGKFIVYFPTEIAPGDVFWGSSRLRPFGDTPEAKRSNLARLRQLAVEVKPANGQRS